MARLLLCLALVAPADAMVLVPAEFGQLAREAAAIVRGRVVETRAVWVDGRRRVETLVVLEIAETYKGNWGPRVTFQLPGGRMGRYRSVMVGAPQLAVGDEAIFFLGARPPALPFILGMSQGIYRVQVDPAGQRRVTTPVLMAGAELAGKVQRGDPARRALTLQEFAARVQEALAAAPPRSGARLPGRGGDR
jgi:hypothetical protein